MKRQILLLTTGQCEWRGLPPFLAAAFADRSDVSCESVGDVYTSFTSEEIQIAQLSIPTNGTRGPVEKLAKALLSVPLDYYDCSLALAVDDLELVNAGQAGQVYSFFRSAVVSEIARLKLDEREKQLVRKRCSFHLLAPMVEGYFFADSSAVSRACQEAGGSPSQPWSTTSSPTLEDFATTDTLFVDRITSPDRSKQDRKGNKDIAWCSSDRERHPKRYIQFLCRAASHGYREGRGGVAALSQLDARKVVAAKAPLMSNMLADIEDCLGLSPGLGIGGAPPVPGVIRNL